MKTEALFRMPLLVVVALWLLRRRAALHYIGYKQIQVEPVNFGDELAIFEYIDAFMDTYDLTWLDRALLWVVSERRREVTQLAKYEWMVVGKIPRGNKVDDHN